MNIMPMNSSDCWSELQADRGKPGCVGLRFGGASADEVGAATNRLVPAVIEQLPERGAY